MTDMADWRSRVGDVWAEEWRRTDRSLSDLSRHLDAAIRDAAPVRTSSRQVPNRHAGPDPASPPSHDERLAPSRDGECHDGRSAADAPGASGEPGSCPDGCEATPSGTVLDVGCGAGATSLALAAARPDLAVTGIDLSPALVAIAADRVPAARFRVADAATASPGVAADLLVSRHGVMFFADPVAAFANLRRHAAWDARLVFSCFADPADNAFAHDLPASVFGTAPMPGLAPGPFAFADPDRVATVLAAAGWRDATVERIAFDYIAGAGDDPVADAVSFLSRIGPCARGLSGADPDDRARLAMRLVDALARYRDRDRIVLPASAWLWRARK